MTSVERYKVYGDNLIGKRNLQMIEIASELGAPAKFPGSGGAVIGIYAGNKQCNDLRKMFLKCGFKYAEVSVEDSRSSLSKIGNI